MSKNDIAKQVQRDARKEVGFVPLRLVRLIIRLYNSRRASAAGRKSGFANRCPKCGKQFEGKSCPKCHKDQRWKCLICGKDNNPKSTSCEGCNMQRSDKNDQWKCDVCKKFNGPKSEKCEGCGVPRNPGDKEKQ